MDPKSQVQRERHRKTLAREGLRKVLPKAMFRQGSQAVWAQHFTVWSQVRPSCVHGCREDVRSMIASRWADGDPVCDVTVLFFPEQAPLAPPSPSSALREIILGCSLRGAARAGLAASL